MYSLAETNANSQWATRQANLHANSANYCATTEHGGAEAGPMEPGF